MMTVVKVGLFSSYYFHKHQNVSVDILVPPNPLVTLSIRQSHSLQLSAHLGFCLKCGPEVLPSFPQNFCFTYVIINLHLQVRSLTLYPSLQCYSFNLSLLILQYTIMQFF
jgi:hypothetical protein